MKQRKTHSDTQSLASPRGYVVSALHVSDVATYSVPISINEHGYID